MAKGERCTRVSRNFSELDWRQTPLGEITLRRRLEPELLVEIYEVLLGDEFLMSSLFVTAEVELARKGLAEVSGTSLDVIVGGLGLGYTARAVLADPRVRSLRVIEVLDAVIDWHRGELLPVSGELIRDQRCHLERGDFFAAAAAGFGLSASSRCHAVLVDIDHTPHHLLHPSHAAFYSGEGLGWVMSSLHPGGVFALWSDDPPDQKFIDLLAEVFDRADAHVVTFANHYTGLQSANTVYVAAVAVPPATT